MIELTILGGERLGNLLIIVVLHYAFVPSTADPVC
jgi:hypothetical protein